MLTITATAREKFKELMKENEGKSLRIVFEGFGWGGPKLGLSLDETKKTEETYTVNEIELLIEERVLPYTKGTEIDFVTNAHGQGFTIAPTSGSRCWSKQ